MSQTLRIPPFLTRYQLVNARLPISVSAAEGSCPTRTDWRRLRLLIEDGRIASDQGGTVGDRSMQRRFSISTAGSSFRLHGCAHPSRQGAYLAASAQPGWELRLGAPCLQADRENWSAADLRARMRFGLECAYAHGTWRCARISIRCRRRPRSPGRSSPNCARPGAGASSCKARPSSPSSSRSTTLISARSDFAVREYRRWSAP